MPSKANRRVKKSNNVDTPTSSSPASIPDPFLSASPLNATPPAKPSPLRTYDTLPSSDDDEAAQAEVIVEQQAWRVSGDLESEDASSRSPRKGPLIDFGEDSPRSAKLELEEQYAGHVRTPVLSRPPTMLESLTRTVRDYLPIPISLPAPPTVSRSTVQGGLNPRRLSTEIDAGSQAGDAPSSAGLNADGERIAWSRWDSTVVGSGSRRLLIVGYMRGLQVWDVSALDSVREIVNVSHFGFGSPIDACFVRNADGSTSSLLVVVLKSSTDTQAIAYSTESLEPVANFNVVGAANVEASGRWVVITSINPAAIHILSAPSFAPMHVLELPSLSLYTPPLIQPRESSATTPSSTHRTPIIPPPTPVSAIHGRLLAYASPQSPTTSTSASSKSQRPTSSDIGKAALKVGGAVWSGMRTLGGMAVEAARTHGGWEGNQDTTESGFGEGGEEGRAGTFFSRSAPAGSEGGSITEHERQHTQPHSGVASPSQTPREAAASSLERGLSGWGRSTKAFITILDLEMTPIRPVAVISLSIKGGISKLSWAADGTSLLATSSAGYTVELANVYTKSLAVPTSPTESPPTIGSQYSLVRGRTSAVVETISTSLDGRWAGISTRRRTIHVFATNPYGGPPDPGSHLRGKVLNPPFGTQGNFSVPPLTRIRMAKVNIQPERDTASPPVTFTFLEPPHLSNIPRSLLPPSSSRQTPSGKGSELPLSPPADHRPSNYQDALVFDPITGVLTLHRLVVELRSGETRLGNAINGTSISLPVSVAAGVLATSTARNATSRGGASVEDANQLVGQDGTVASWSIRRGSDWPEVKGRIQSSSSTTRTRLRRVQSNSDFLAEAELSTFGSSPIGPTASSQRSIYLSRQASFHALQEDYHGFIRSYRFNLPQLKLAVRREVHANLASSKRDAGVEESFVEGFSTAPMDIRRQSSASFDKPIAAAISDPLDPGAASPVLPMYPNGTPGSHPSSFRAPIPIRSVASGISEGVSEGFGRFRREMNKVRSPRRVSQGSSLDIPTTLEFDEDEEEFARREVEHTEISIPDEHAWDQEDHQAVEDAERYEDMDFAGLLDEEHEQQRQAAAAKAAQQQNTKVGGKGKRKKK